MTDIIKIGITGASGRMGRANMKAILAQSKCKIEAAFDHEGNPFLGKDIGSLIGEEPQNIAVKTLKAEDLNSLDVVIDFTRPEATIEIAQLCASANTALVVGTTGLSEQQDQQLMEAAYNTVIVKSGNMSLGVNLLAGLVKKAAEALDEDFDIEILEMHHRMKVDAPSGTALMLGEAAANGRQIDLKEKSTMSREGITGERDSGEIGFATLRGGTVVGEHSAIFAGANEVITLSHRAENREIFAQGSVKAAIWAAQQSKSGFYSMADVLGL